MNTDLYKYAMWFQPFTSSDLVSLGYEPFRVETPQGRVEYVQQQRDLTAAAASLRARLLTEVSALSGALPRP